ncbi:MAG TPA: MBG domain-containing protein, partial [Gallionella sp.]|nr:MBG domain-containing protein [Gallionella sp.]
GGFVNGETSAVLGGALVYGGTSQGAVGAGSYAITPGGLTSGNYTIAFNDGVLTVNPAPLTVTANDVSRFYDGMAWSGGNGVVYNGFVNGETSAVLGGALVYGGNSQGAVNAGSYAITPSGLTSGNYTIAFNDGTLNINQRIPTIPGAPVDSYSGATDREAGTASGATEDVSAVAPADAAGGKVGSVKLSSDAAASASANQYVFVTQACGLRLPEGLDCR